MPLADRLVSHLASGRTPRRPSLTDSNVVTCVDGGGNVTYRRSCEPRRRDEDSWKPPAAVNAKDPDFAKPHGLPSHQRVIVPKDEEQDHAYFGLQTRST